jgi:hypothetical protein
MWGPQNQFDMIIMEAVSSLPQFIAKANPTLATKLAFVVIEI